MATILVTGMSGSLAQLVGLELLRRGDTVVGVDYRARPSVFPQEITFYQANYNKTRIHDVFRRHRPEAVLHLGRVGNLKVREQKRFDLNVLGSAKIQELSIQYGVKRLIVFSTFHIYGAHAHNHIPIFEDEPLRALQTIPQLADAVQLDTQAVAWTWRFKDELQTVVLRPTNVIGPHINNTVSRYLRLKRPPAFMGFNPMWQFIHEADVLRALLRVLDADEAHGVYNLTGEGSLPIIEALKLVGARPRLIPAGFANLFLTASAKAQGHVPPYLLDFLKYPCIVSDGRFKEAFDHTPAVGLVEGLRSCVSRMPLDSVLP